MKATIIPLFLFSIILLSGCLAAQMKITSGEESLNVEEESETTFEIEEEPLLSSYNDICVYYFRGMACPHCQEVQDNMDELKKRGVTVRTFNVYESDRDQGVMDLFIAYYGIDGTVGVPAVATGENYFIGTIDLLTTFIEFINEHAAEGIECPSFY